MTLIAELSAATTGPRAWVGCLACYNGGELVGQWVSGEVAGELTCDDLHRMEWESRIGSPPVGEDYDLTWAFELRFDSDHEELWVMDHDGYEGLLEGECSPMEAQEKAELYHELERRGIDIPAFTFYLDYMGPDPDIDDAMGEFEDRFRGEWDSEEDFAMELADDLGVVTHDLSWPLNCIDWERAARDLFWGGDYWSGRRDGSLYIFSSY